jgi:hypothetical protein
MAELVKFSLNFKVLQTFSHVSFTNYFCLHQLNKPIPDDLVPILAKDEDKQQKIKEKSLLDATSTSARAIGASTPATASWGVAVAGTKMSKLVMPALKPSGATMENPVVPRWRTQWCHDGEPSGADGEHQWECRFKCCVFSESQGISKHLNNLCYHS